LLPGVLAPYAEGYFDLDLDFSDVDVSFEYTISISPSETSDVLDLLIFGYSIDEDIGDSIDDSEILSFEDVPEITHVIDYDEDIILEGITTRKIRVFIKWSDDPATTVMDNAADTLVTMDPLNRGIFDVSISFTQII